MVRALEPCILGHIIGIIRKPSARKGIQAFFCGVPIDNGKVIEF